MASTSTSDEERTTIQLDTLSLEQLDQVKQREESRLHALSTRYQALRGAAARIAASQQAVSEFRSNQNAAVLVPLTESVYVPGTTPPQASSSFLVELGTGYYCEHDTEGTLAFLGRKGDLVDANSDNGTLLGWVYALCMNVCSAISPNSSMY